jgi:hypothetical protein
MSATLFPGLTLPNLGLCCNIQILPTPWGPLPIPMITVGIAFPAAIIAAYAVFVAALQTLYDLIAIPCPNQ